MKKQYKCLQGTIKLWCFTKWGSCDVICATEPSIDSADVVAFFEDKRFGFIFTDNKTTIFLKQQIINCRKTCNKVYLITNEINIEDLPKADNNIRLLNITNKYGFGNIIEEL